MLMPDKLKLQSPLFEMVITLVAPAHHWKNKNMVTLREDALSKLEQNRC